MQPIRVLIVDDSSLVRAALEQGLARDPLLEVIGSAADPYQARDLLVRLRPDVMTLDVEMPKMDGITFLRRLMPQWPIPVVMLSSLTERGANATIRALEAGAIDFVCKPSGSGGLAAILDQLCAKIRMAAQVDVRGWLRPRPAQQPPTNRPTQSLTPAPRLILIGASTGGTQALHRVFADLPPQLPPIVVVQHMPEHFTRMFAERLDATSQLQVKEAAEGDCLRPGSALIAPGGRQLRIQQGPHQTFSVRVREEGLVNGHQPSCDPLFRSCIPFARHCWAVMLTGMGSDGAQALLALRQAGAHTLGQDQASSVVYGMPKAAFECGAIVEQLPLERIAARLATCSGGPGALP